MTPAAPQGSPLGDPVCIGADGPIGPGRFLADVAAARARLMGHDAICNMAPGRYDFAVLLVAAMANGQTTVLPPSRADGAVAAALAGWAAPLVADGLDALGLGRATPAGAAGVPTLPALPGQVHVFTSGSTGTPIRHVKTWHSLAAGARLTAEIVARAGLPTGRTALLGTTPHQHMYGLEAAILAGLAHGCCLHGTTVFFPADIEPAVALAEAQGIARIVLVTSPPHLRFLEEAILATPQIACVISATAPLHRDVARRIEADGGRKVFEIYGSTETGSLAWRRSAQTDIWTPLDGFEILPGPEAWYATAPHLDAAMPLGDEIAPLGDGRFRLLGRRGDMVSIAGKRQTLGALNAALATMPGLTDAVILSEPGDGDDRLTVFVVTDAGADRDLSPLRRAIRAHLIGFVDPVFVPRRIHRVARIPR
ncbi:MAG: AMP-binding protein, partial [Thermohalobaculum sp.]|nr:AMP-binding protein [Thermohalobaculum sp.]